MDIQRVIRNAANWCNGSTVLGIGLGVVGRGRFRRHRQLVVIDKVRLPLINASAMTVGSVVLVPDATLEDASSRIPLLIEHEDAHAWQYAYCMGLPFLLCYLVATLWSLARTRHRAYANFFEVQAGLEIGGYRAPSCQ